MTITPQEQPGRLAMATQFKIGEILGTPILIELRGYGKWAVTFSHDCLTADGEWVREPRPSSRSDEFLSRTRFSMDEAFELGRKVLAELQSEDGLAKPPGGA